jgi:hypothetical protein
MLTTHEQYKLNIQGILYHPNTKKIRIIKTQNNAVGGKMC